MAVWQTVLKVKVTAGLCKQNVLSLKHNVEGVYFQA